LPQEGLRYPWQELREREEPHPVEEEVPILGHKWTGQTA